MLAKVSKVVTQSPGLRVLLGVQCQSFQKDLEWLNLRFLDTKKILRILEFLYEGLSLAPPTPF